MTGSPASSIREIRSGLPRMDSHEEGIAMNVLGTQARSGLLGLLALCVVLALSPYAAMGSPSVDSADGARESFDLNAGWRFHQGAAQGAQLPHFDDSTWPTVEVPHTWNAEDGQDGGGTLVGGGDYFRGDGWYRRTVDVPEGLAGRRLFLQFDGANTVTDVWVNGVHLGQHRGGYARFRFDATDALEPGESNQVAVRVSNAKDPDVAPLSADFTFGGGLYRDVSLVATTPVHIEMLDHASPGVYLRQRTVTPQVAEVDVTTKLANDSSETREVQARATVTDADGQVVARTASSPRSVAPGQRGQVISTAVVDDPHLWQGTEDPYLYSVRVVLRDSASGALLDAVRQPLGLRTVAIDPDTGFHLNGREVELRGVNRHQDREDKGFAVSDADHREDFALLEEMGVNALRTAHYQQDELVYDLADRAGFTVFTEVPWVNEMTDSDAFRDNVKQQMRELIRQNYNHPSVAFWGIGNELGFFQRDKDPQINALLAKLADIVRAEDPERFSGYANVLARADEDQFTSHADASGYNRYEGWYDGTTEMFGVWADALHARNPERAIGVTEYGAGASIHQHQEPNPSFSPDPFGPWHPEEYQSRYHEDYLKQIESRDYFWGTFVWNMFDFASDGRNEGDRPGINDKGLVTHDRKVKKDAFYWYKANWSDEPVTYITSRRWTDRTVPTTTVKVYSNADEVRLYLNGESVGTKTSDDHIFAWPVELQSGDNAVVAESIIDAQTHTDRVTWTLTP